MKPTFRIKINNGKVVFEDRYKFDEFLKGIEDKEKLLIIDDIKKPRSENENRYYWGVVIKILADELGYLDKNDVHDAMRLRFLKENGKLETIRSTASLSTQEFEEYLSKIRIFASSELNIIIPEPNSVEF